MSAWDEKRALRYLLWLLGRRDHARAELEKRLERKQVDPDVAARALARVEELDLIDDVRTAKGFVRGRKQRQGRLVLQREMRKRGLGEEAREEALAPLGDEQQRRTAAEVLEKHAWRFATGDRRKDRAKAASFLARRGFPADAVHQALDAFLDARDAEDGRDDEHGRDDEGLDVEGLDDEHPADEHPADEGAGDEEPGDRP